MWSGSSVFFWGGGSLQEVCVHVGSEAYQFVFLFGFLWEGFSSIHMYIYFNVCV